MSCKSCQPCGRLSKEETASHWCIQCNELLCETCYDYHKILRFTKDHCFLTINEYDQFSTILSSISIHCKIHNEKIIEYYCQNHNCFVCSLCKKESHSDCGDAKHVAELPGQLNNAQNLSSRIESLYKELELACENRSENLKTLAKQREDYIATIQEKRKNLQQLLYDLDMKLGAFESDHSVKTKELHEQLETLKRAYQQIKERKQNIHSLMKLQSASDIYFVLAERKIKEQQDKHEVELEYTFSKLLDLQYLGNISFKTDNQKITLVDSFKFVSKNCSFRIQELIQPEVDSSTVEAEAEANLFDSSQVDCASSQLVNNSEKLQALNLCDKNKISQEKDIISSLNERLCVLKFCFQVDKKNLNTNITCVKVLQNCNLVIGEVSNPRLMIYSKRGVRTREYKLKHGPNSIVVIGDSIAVTLKHSVIILSVKDYDDMKCIRAIPMNDTCFGIACIDQNLVVNCSVDGLKFVTLSGHTTSTHKSITGKLNMCTNSNKTLYTVKQSSDIVMCFNLNTTVNSSIRCTKLSGANDIVMDREENIYVTCDQSHSVYMLRKSTSQWCTVLNKAHNMLSPRGIACDLQNNELIVVNNNGKSVCIYKMKSL
ncbi:Hypothetical predicted protein [Mytilus galloprovincialis]|uniref:B box-type domain-containing protein n=1 Tax=Mytilus galloprovincialis TaxID=29158 RepID=A0A8B6GUR7_MYTGA|nr:Hypothetical predicted protein [Mytilus galloprovincialis]